MTDEMPKMEIEANGNEYMDIEAVKKALVRISIVRRTGKEPNAEIFAKFLKYLEMAYENNKSKSNIDNRIASIILTLENKYDKYSRILNF